MIQDKVEKIHLTNRENLSLSRNKVQVWLKTTKKTFNQDNQD